MFILLSYMRTTRFIDEAEFFRLILHSQMSKMQKFVNWLLPSMRNIYLLKTFNVRG
jgi:prophage antirepressor-like protein